VSLLESKVKVDPTQIFGCVTECTRPPGQPAILCDQGATGIQDQMLGAITHETHFGPWNQKTQANRNGERV
jgi:hypothetical protein